MENISINSKILLIISILSLFLCCKFECQGQDCYEFWVDYGTKWEKCLYRGTKSGCERAQREKIKELKRQAYGTQPDFMGVKKALGDEFLKKEVPRYSIKPCKNGNTKSDRSMEENNEAIGEEKTWEEGETHVDYTELRNNTYNTAIENNKKTDRLLSDDRYNTKDTSISGSQPTRTSPPNIDKILNSATISNSEYNKWTQEYLKSELLGKDFGPFAKEKYSAYLKEKNAVGSSSDYQTFYNKLKNNINQEIKKQHYY